MAPFGPAKLEYSVSTNQGPRYGISIDQSGTIQNLRETMKKIQRITSQQTIGWIFLQFMAKRQS